jgi:hypothetical protein
VETFPHVNPFQPISLPSSPHSPLIHPSFPSSPFPLTQLFRSIAILA